MSSKPPGPSFVPTSQDEAVVRANLTPTPRADHSLASASVLTLHPERRATRAHKSSR